MHWWKSWVQSQIWPKMNFNIRSNCKMGKSFKTLMNFHLSYAHTKTQSITLSNRSSRLLWTRGLKRAVNKEPPVIITLLNTHMKLNWQSGKIKINLLRVGSWAIKRLFRICWGHLNQDTRWTECHLFPVPIYRLNSPMDMYQLILVNARRTRRHSGRCSRTETKQSIWSASDNRTWSILQT